MKKTHWLNYRFTELGGLERRSACGSTRRLKWMTDEIAKITCLGCRAKYEEKFGPRKREEPNDGK